MNLHEIQNVLDMIDANMNGDAYTVKVHTVSGNCYVGGAYQPKASILRIDQTNTLSITPVFIEIAKIEAIELDL